MTCPVLKRKRKDESEDLQQVSRTEGPERLQ